MAAPELLPLGPDGVLVRFSEVLSEPANRAALAFRAVLEATRPEGVVETATSLTSVLVRFRPDRVSRSALCALLERELDGADWADRPLPPGRALWHIPAAFEGGDAPDLEDAAALAGVSPEVAVAEVTGRQLRVLALGFAPGQPYLGFLPGHWDIPRRTSVTPEMPRGALVVAVRQVIPFANATPTGWRQIGRTAFRCYDPEGDPHLPLKPGDEVRFQRVSTEALARHGSDPRGGAEREDLP